MSATADSALDRSDGRYNLRDADSLEWHVFAVQSDQTIAGPFGSEEYAHTVRDRLSSKWTDRLVVDFEVAE
jgi:hypothetical protein